MRQIVEFKLQLVLKLIVNYIYFFTPLKTKYQKPTIELISVYTEGFLTSGSVHIGIDTSTNNPYVEDFMEETEETYGIGEI